MSTPRLTLGERCYVLRAPNEAAYVGRGNKLVAADKAVRFVSAEVAEAAIVSAAAELASSIVLTVERWEVCVTTGAPEAP